MRLHRNCLLLLLTAMMTTPPAASADSAPEKPVYKVDRDIAYRGEDAVDEYIRERCRLDVYHPVDQKGFATVIWLHAGGMTQGNKFIPYALKNKGLAIVAVNYRLSPKVKAPAYIEDTAAAVAWTLDNIERYGGDPDKVFLTGASAGGYLAMMVGLDRSYLKAHDRNPDRLAGIVSFSGQAITHFTVRAEQGIHGKRPVVDALAPLNHVRKDAPPLLLVTGDRELDLPGRYEENAYLRRMMTAVGHQDNELFELEGYDHGGMTPPAYPLLLRFVNRLAGTAKPDAD